MRSFAPAEFWRHYEQLPKEIQKLADKNFALFDQNPLHPSLHFKELKNGVWAARVGQRYRSLAETQTRWLDVVLDWHARRI